MGESESDSDEEIIVDENGKAMKVEKGKLMPCPIMTQKIKTYEPCVPQGTPVLPPQQTSHTMVRPYSPAELEELAAKFRQKGSESITGWLLWLWDIGMAFCLQGMN